MLAHLTARPRRTLLVALAFLLVAGVIGGPVAGALKDDGGFQPADSGSERASARIKAAIGQAAAPGVILLVDAPDKAAGAERTLARIPGIASTASGGRALRSTDGRRAVVTGTLAADADEDAVTDAVEERFGDAPGVTPGGPLLADTQVSDRIGADLGRAELLAFPLLALLSLLFFRGRAALLPLGVGIATVLTTFLALRGVNAVYGLSVFALNLVVGLGLGLAIDYTLLLVTRFREELAGDSDRAVQPAVARTMRSAGRTVAFSAATVAAALITLTVFPLGFAKSMGIAGAVVAIAAALAALVLTPALFALWGPKLLVAPRGKGGERSGWYRLAHAVMRRPALVAVATAGLMLVATAPSLRAQFTPIDASVIPRGESSRIVADALTADFPALTTSPVTVVLDAPADAAAYARGLERLPGVQRVAPPRTLDRGATAIAVTVTGRAEGTQAQRVVRAIRSGPQAGDVLVGGAAAAFVDQQDAIGARLPLALALLVLLTFGVLWVMTGSVVLPLKAILMNALTVATALGALTLVYQDGRFERLLHYTSNGGVEATDFLVTATLVFALSTDYGVFLLGRIKEARDAGAGERESVRARPGAHGQHGHRGGDPARGGNRRVCDQLHLVHPADRRRDRRGRADRRVHRARAARARADGAARPLELVVARAAAAAQPPTSVA